MEHSTGPLVERRRFWIECLSGQDQASIWRQLSSVIWYAAAYRVVNESRRLAELDDDGAVRQPALINDLIDHSFWVSQAVEIRRLVDSYPLVDRKRGVYSLTGLLDDMIKHHALLTRANVFAAEGLEYDYSAIRRAQEEYLRDRVVQGERISWIPKELDWQRHEERHQQVDLLTNLAGERTSIDAISVDLLNHLKQRVMSRCRPISTVVNKMLAHASTPEVRSTLDPAELRLTLGQLWSAHQALIETSNFVSIYILGESQLGMLAVPQFDHLRHFDVPFSTRDRRPELQKVWDEYDQQTHTWTNWGIQELLAERRDSTNSEAEARRGKP